MGIEEDLHIPKRSCVSASLNAASHASLSSKAPAALPKTEAAEENTSVSRLLGGFLEKQMRSSDEYWEACQKWKQLQPVDLDAETRLSREAANGR